MWKCDNVKMCKCGDVEIWRYGNLKIKHMSYYEVLFEVQRTETFIEKKINDFFSKVQRTETTGS